MNITVFGAGYLGLVTSTCFAELGNHLLRVDVNKAPVARLRAGIIPMYEPGPSTIIERAIAGTRLSFKVDAAEGVADEDGSADLKQVLAVAETIDLNMTTTKIVVDKSTDPVGTADKVKDLRKPSRVAAALAQRRHQAASDTDTSASHSD